MRFIADEIRKQGIWKENKDKELIFCINGTGEPGYDNSVKIAEELAKEDPAIKVITLQEKGKNYACNELVRRSRKDSEVLFFIDADVKLREGTLDALNRALIGNPRLAAAGAISVFAKEPTKKHEFLKRRIMDSKNDPASSTQRVINGRCYAIRKSEAEKIRMPKDQRIHEDDFLTLKLWDRFRVVKEAVVYSHAPNVADALRLQRRTEVSSTLLRRNYPKLAPILDGLISTPVPFKGRQIRRVMKTGVSMFRKVSGKVALMHGVDTWPKMKSTKRPWK